MNLDSNVDSSSSAPLGTEASSKTPEEITPMQQATNDIAPPKAPPKEPPKAPPTPLKRFLKEWVYHLVVTVLVISLIKWLVLDVYVIPTPSMESSILVGDFVLVSKLSYGARTFRTPLQVPLTNGVLWGTETPSFLDWISLPSYRLPGIGEVERGEIVVFHYPPETTKPSDVRTLYVKRCVALPKDRLVIRKAAMYINGLLAEDPPHMQRRYLLKSVRGLRERVFDKQKIWEVSKTNGNTYLMHTTPLRAAELEKKAFAKEVRPLIQPAEVVDESLFPHSSAYLWNTDNYGPLIVPYQGFSIQLNDTTLSLYGKIIQDHEEIDNVVVDSSALLIGGQRQTSYTFKKDYYFMMGDNRDNSQDSRYWGFVPFDHVVGKVQLCLVSIDRRAPFWRAFRWSRIFKPLD